MGSRPPAVVFSSWHGRYSDSPRAISQELRRRGIRVQEAWICPEAATGKLPSGAARIEPGGEEEAAALAAADWIVSNDVLPLAFDKAEGARYLQTWHGTPLKRIGYDVVAPTFPDAAYHYAVELARDVARWDVMLSPNRFSTSRLRAAFRFEGEILETGYPRNDVLRSPAAGAIRARVRRDLGIGEDVRAVLYAPTWRDQFSMRIELDLARVHAAFGDEVVVLVRSHGLTAANSPRVEALGARDVTHVEDISELYLAADVLLTDYSSAMFDFAVTRKPMLFYTYDLEDYRDRVRGFYFDFEAEAPGPLLPTTAHVAAALRDLDRVVDRHADAYERFVARFCHLDDGHAASRVVDAAFAGARHGAVGAR